MKIKGFSIIIPNYNGASFLTNCLRSLSTAIKKCPDIDFEIILVDNGSTDNSILIFKKLIHSLEITTIRKSPCGINWKLEINSTNIGFAGAINQGINKAKYYYICLLNNDLTLAPDWFKIVSSEILKATDPKIVTFCGTVLNKEGNKYESQGLNFDYRGKCTNISNGQTFSSTALKHHSATELIWGSSAALVVYQKDVIKKIGMFDEDFFAYEEDVDLALRLHKLGYKTLYLPTALSHHLGGGTSNKMGNFRHIHDTKNWFFIIIKDYSWSEITTNFISICSERLRNLSGLIKNTPINKLPKSFWFAYSPVILKINHILSKRRQFQNLLKSTK